MVVKGRTHARQAACLALLLAAAGCAGSGHRYGLGCDPDGGSCQTADPDGGHPGLPGFVSTPVLIAHDGRHDGYPDVARFAGQLFAVYRRGAGRALDGAAQLQVARSADEGHTWAAGPSLALPGFDVRDPKLTVFRGKLLLTFTAWDVRDPTANRAFVRAASSDDGSSLVLIDPPSLPQPYGLSAWRPRALDEALLLPVWTADQLLKHPELDRASLLRSADGVNFGVASLLPIGGGVAEPELLVQAGGKLLVTAPEQQTGSQPQRQSYCRPTRSGGATSSWDCWTAPGPRIETPALFDWKGTLLLAGR